MLLHEALDTQDPPPEIYKLWKIFTNPATGHLAVAVSTVHANTFISFYTLLIGLGVAFTWVILVSLVILFLTPSKMTRTTYIALIATWSQSEPWTASWVLALHTWKVFRGAWGNKHPGELTWSAFRFDMAFLTVALVTAGGGIALGPIFSRTFTVGNIAPVNSKFVYVPSYTGTDDVQGQRVSVEYDGLAALKAFRSVDGAEASSDVRQDVVTVDWEPLQSINGEDRYSIQYNYKVSGVDMGLQKLRDLTLEVSGNCTFQENWWFAAASYPDTADASESMTLYDIFINWAPDTLVQYPDVEQTPFNYTTETFKGNNSRPIYIPIYPRSPPAANFYSAQYTTENLNQATGRSYFVIIPLTARVSTVGTSTDPWYATQASNISTLMEKYPEMVKSQRPPLLCQENNEWSLHGWKGTMQNLISDGSDSPPLPIPPGIKFILQTGLGPLPMMFTLGRALRAGSLQSSTRLVGEEGAIDTQNAQARDDITRLVHASYLATVSLFHDAAVAGSVLKSQIASGVLVNPLANNVNGPGSGDFVITSSAVRALSLRALIAIPIVLVILGAIVISSQAGRTVRAHNDTSTHPGRLDRYIKLVTGLKATQLYRMIDQLIADRAPSDLEGWDGKRHKIQAQWVDQTEEFPFVAPNEHANSGDEIILPYFHVQVKGPVGYAGKDQRLTLDVTRFKEDVTHWRSLQPGDGHVRLDHMDRQRQEEEEFRINDEYSQLAPLIRNRPTSLPGSEKSTSTYGFL